MRKYLVIYNKLMKRYEPLMIVDKNNEEEEAKTIADYQGTGRYEEVVEVTEDGWSYVRSHEARELREEYKKRNQ